MPMCCYFATQRFLLIFSPYSESGDRDYYKCSITPQPTCMAPSSLSFLFPFFFCRSSFGHLPLTYINPNFPKQETRMYQQYTQKPPGGRVGCQNNLGWQRSENYHSPPSLNPGLGVREGIWCPWGCNVVHHSLPHLPVGAIASPLDEGAMFSTWTSFS